MTDHEKALAILAEMEARKAAPGYWDEFASAVVRDAPRAYAALRAVLEIHTPWGIYDDCGHDHQSTDGPGVLDIEDVGLTCEEGRVQTVCRHCALTEDEPDENTCEHDWPCPTVRAVAEKLEGK